MSGRRARRLKQGLRLSGAASAGYLLGTIPTADIAARMATGGQVDLRSAGSGNPGAANAVKVLGAKFGYAVMAADIAKGAVAAGLGRRLAGDTGAHLGASASVIGHCLPVWNGFRGGKGVAASIGQCVVTFPAYFPIDPGVAAITAASPRWKQRAFAATAVASAAWVGASVLWWRKGWPNLWGPAPSAALPAAAIVSSGVIMYRFSTAPPPPANPPRNDPPMPDPLAQPSTSDAVATADP